jgi:adenylyltransferase/sulfurtransferase
MIGILQAIEVIKILTQTGSTMHDTVLMYDALQCCFLRIKKTGKKHTCGVCGHDPWIKCMEDSVQASIGESSHAVKAVSQLEGFLSPRKNHSSNHAIPTVSCADYFKLASTKEHVLLDVRVAQQYAMIRLKDSVNIPVENLHAMLPKVELLSGGTKEVYCICRRGIASLEATRIIMDAIASGQYPNIHSVRNIDGGLVAWSREVDTDFPIY